jgi:hypothetical protein
MRKTALFIAAAMAITAPSLAYAKKGKKGKAKPAASAAFKPAPAVDNSKFFMEAGHQFFVPAEQITKTSMMAPTKADKPKKMKKKKRSKKK